MSPTPGSGLGRRMLLVRVVVALGATATLIASWVVYSAPEDGHPHAAAAALHASGAHEDAPDHLGRDHRHEDPAGGHGDSEGVRLVAATGESVESGGSCPATAPVRHHDVAAIAIDITLNRFLDHDPDGRMYALVDDIPALRAEEAQNRDARAGRADPAVSLGQQGDLLQPLTLRALPGDCLRIRLENQLDEAPASIHVHGSSLRVADTGAPAVAANPDALAAPGGAVTYEWMIPADEPEATHYFHSHGDERAQTSHGLFGAIVVEPAGSTWTDPLTGEPIDSGWQAVISPPDEPSFREFTIFYHEIGNELEQFLDKDDKLIPLVDPITSAYRPSARALNYRSEPFMNRLALQQERGVIPDPSMAYSSYSFGDPATPMLRSYMGDPVKQRVVHGGSEVFHVHHVHGGTVRWPRQPGVEGTTFASDTTKTPPMLPGVSERTDSQSLGPSESFDIEPECVAGGCQGAAGDFMFHCHVAHHYLAGMWGIARTYNTLQDGIASTDDLPPLLPLPDRDDAVAPAVTSDALIGTTVDAPSGPVQVTSDTLADLVEDQLPPAGVPAPGDASVLDWVREGDRWLNEPSSVESWPGHDASSDTATRPPMLFDPRTARLAYPMLQPHLMARPPFAPGHGPSPFLGPAGNGRDPPRPADMGSSGVCPAESRLRSHAINAIQTPIFLNREENILDPNGMLFVLREQRDQAIEDPALQVPLAIRANAGEDCVDVLFRSELLDDAATPFSKVGIHIHFVQFDVQASDGVNTGFSWEQTVRPYQYEAATAVAAAAADDRKMRVADASRLRPGALVGVGMELDERFEVARIASIDGDTITFADPLRHRHESGELISPEFVRYRWYPDAQFGTAYFHDHVKALETWRHGLFGALVAEPPGSTWTDPVTGDPLASGPIADIHTDQPVGVDATGSFRELLLFTQDGNPLTHERRSTGSSINLRVEPLDKREGAADQLFSSIEHGDPETPILRAHLGDPVVIRDLVGAANEIHTLHVDGHWFRVEPWSELSPPVATVNVGISERYDLVIPAAGGPQAHPGDYLYENGRPIKLEEGSWGLLRVLPPGDPAIVALDGDAVAEGPRDVCPSDAAIRTFEVDAVEAELPFRSDGVVFVAAADADAVMSGQRVPHPLVLRATVGDCLEVTLTNRLEEGTVGFRTDLLARAPDEDGVAVGNIAEDAVDPGQSRTYRIHAREELGEVTALVRDGGDPVGNVRAGAYGAIVIAEQGSRFVDPVTGTDIAPGSSAWRADVVPPVGPAYRDVVVFLHDEDEAIGSHLMPYRAEVDRPVAVNYRSEPLEGRTIAEAVADGASTPVFEAVAGDPVRVHVVAPVSEQAQVFAIEGHRWPQEPGRAGTPRLSSQRIGGLESLTLHLESAGGPLALPGAYLYGNHRVPFEEAGAWGIFRVHPAAVDGLAALPGDGPGVAAWLVGVAVLALTGVGAILLLRRAAARRRAGSRRPA